MRKIIFSGILIFSGAILFAGQAENFGRTLKTSTNATEVGIKFFSGTWQEALTEAKDNDKLIFLDAYASWCGPCKLMSAKTFTDKSVGEFFNEKFVNYKMDMEKHTDGERLSSKFKLTAYPTLYFVDGSENVVHQSLGYMEPKQLISQGSIALEKM